MENEEIKELCRQHGIELMVLFGSSARETQHSGSDVDVAVRPKRGMAPSKLDLIYHFGGLFQNREIDLVILNVDTDPVLLHEIFSGGKPLYEDRPGIFDEERLRAYKLYFDTEKIRRLRAEYLRAFVEKSADVA